MSVLEVAIGQGGGKLPVDTDSDPESSFECPYYAQQGEARPDRYGRSGWQPQWVRAGGLVPTIQRSESIRYLMPLNFDCRRAILSCSDGAGPEGSGSGAGTLSSA